MFSLVYLIYITRHFILYEQKHLDEVLDEVLGEVLDEVNTPNAMLFAICEVTFIVLFIFTFHPIVTIITVFLFISFLFVLFIFVYYSCIFYELCVPYVLATEIRRRCVYNSDFFSVIFARKLYFLLTLDGHHYCCANCAIFNIIYKTP